MRTMEISEGSRKVIAVDDADIRPPLAVGEEDITPAPKSLVEEPGLELTTGEQEAAEALEEEKREIEVTTWQTPKEFLGYLRRKVENPLRFPKNSIRGIERQILYYKGLEREISRAIDQDASEGSLTGEELIALDELTERIQEQIRGLEKRKNSLSKGIGTKAEEENGKLKKKAYTGIVQLVADPFIDAIVKKCINAKVSSGKNIEEVFSRLSKKYALNEREKLAALNLLTHYGYPVRTNAYDPEELIEQYYA